MRTGFAGLILMICAVTMSAGVPGEQADRGKFGDPGKACRARDGAGDASTKGLAPALVGARTVFLISELALVDKGWLGELRQELQRWHRWEEVPRREAADVTVSISVIRGEGGGELLELGIRAKATGSVLWASSGRDVVTVFKALEERLPSLDGACAPIQVL